MSTSTLAPTASAIAATLSELGLLPENSGVSTGSTWSKGEGERLESYSPVDGSLIGVVRGASKAEYEQAIASAQRAS
jgi:aldehyde dehydrogenase (NAD+)